MATFEKRYIFMEKIFLKITQRLILLGLLMLIGCQSKPSSTLNPSQSIVGKYTKVSTQPTFVVQQLFFTHQSFRDTTTAIVTQIGKDLYNVEITLSGIAQKGISKDPYGFVVSYDFMLANGESEQWGRGQYNNAYPSSSANGSISTKDTETLLKFKPRALQIKSLINFNTSNNTDASPIIEGELTR